MIYIQDADKIGEYDLKRKIAKKYGHVACSKCGEPTLALDNKLPEGYDPRLREVHCVCCGLREFVLVPNERTRKLLTDRDHRFSMAEIEKAIGKAKK